MKSPMDDPFQFLNDLIYLPDDTLEDENIFYCQECYTGPYDDSVDICPNCGALFDETA